MQFTSRAEFMKAVEQNQAQIQKNLNDGGMDLSDIIFAEGITARELSWPEVGSKYSDILGCTAVNALPSIQKTGADGLIWYSDHDTPTPIETKVCGVRQSDLALGMRGGLYYSVNLDNFYSKCGITSYFAGKFDAGMSWETLRSKARDTFLICFDNTENKIITAYGLHAHTTLALLEQKTSNATITIKLGAFQNHGFTAQSNMKFEGWIPWTRRMNRTVQRRIIYT